MVALYTKDQTVHNNVHILVQMRGSSRQQALSFMCESCSEPVNVNFSHQPKPDHLLTNSLARDTTGGYSRRGKEKAEWNYYDERALVTTLSQYPCGMYHLVQFIMPASSLLCSDGLVQSTLSTVGNSILVCGAACRHSKSELVASLGIRLWARDEISWKKHSCEKLAVKLLENVLPSTWF